MGVDVGCWTEWEGVDCADLSGRDILLKGDILLKVDLAWPGTTRWFDFWFWFFGIHRQTYDYTRLGTGSEEDVLCANVGEVGCCNEGVD